MKKKAIIISSIAFVVVAAIVIAIILIPRNLGINDASTVEEGVPTISIWHQFESDTAERSYLDSLASELQASHSDYQLDIRFYSSAEIRNELLSAKQDGDMPEAVFLNPEWLPELVRLDILSTLDTQEDYAAVAGQLLEGAVETGRRGEHIYGLPFSLSIQMLIYNPDLFFESSQLPPTTIEAMPPAIEAIGSISEETYGLGVTSFDASNLAPFLWSNGGNLVNAEQTEATGFLDSANNIAIVDTFTILYAGGFIYDESQNNDALVDQFGQGRLGMVMADATFLKELQAKYPDMSYETMLVPAGQGGHNTILDSTLICVPASDDSQLGWEFVKTLSDDATQTKFAQMGIMPASRVALESTEASNSVIEPFIESLVTARALPNVTEWKEMNNEFSLTMQQITGGYLSAEQGMSRLATTWDALLP